MYCTELGKEGNWFHPCQTQPHLIKQAARREKGAFFHCTIRKHAVHVGGAAAAAHTRYTEIRSQKHKHDERATSKRFTARRYLLFSFFFRPASRFQPCVFSIVITEWRTHTAKCGRRLERGEGTKERRHGRSTHKKKNKKIKIKIKQLKIPGGRFSPAKPEATSCRLSRISQIFEDDERGNEGENSVREEYYSWRLVMSRQN